MDQLQVIGLLEQHKNPRGIEHWNKLDESSQLKSYGIGLTVLRKLAKQVGKNRELATELWNTDIYDARVISLLIDDPKQITVEQAEQQVEQLNAGMLCHVFTSCGATLAKSPIALELTQRWLDSEDPVRRRCAFGLVHELAGKKSKKITDDFFMAVIQDIEQHFASADKKLLLAMGGALLGIGKRNASLNKAALALARQIGPIDFNEDGKSCEPLDVEKHLTSDYLRKKLQLD